VFVVIDWGNYFGFGFTTLVWKALYYYCYFSSGHVFYQNLLWLQGCQPLQIWIWNFFLLQSSPIKNCHPPPACYISKFPKYHALTALPLVILRTVLIYNLWVFISNIPKNHAFTYTNLESGKRNYSFGKSLEKSWILHPKICTNPETITL